MMEDYDFESWEPDANLYEKEDWKNLLKLRKEFVIRHPNDLYAQERYIEALILNKRYSEAIKYVTPLYEKYYEEGFGIGQIIEALLGLGRSENDFNWIIKPVVLKLDNSTLETCIRFLKRKRKPICITDLYCDLILNSDYAMFKEDSLFDFLKANGEKFIFTGDTDYFYDTKIKFNREKMK